MAGFSAILWLLTQINHALAYDNA